MKKHRLVIGLAAALVVAGAFSATVFAGGVGGNQADAVRYPLCTVETCTRVGCHTHNGATYAPHSQDDGHEYHAIKEEAAASVQALAVSAPVVCPVQACTQAGKHSHNGITYTAHHAADGHSYHTQAPVGTCIVQDCTQVGEHEHDGILYTAHHAEDGHSYHTPTGTCPVQACIQTGNHCHDGVLYSAHHAADGHAYHNPTPTYQGVCPIEGCTATGDHAHDGGIYGQHHNEDGHAYHGQQGHESSGGHNNGGGHNSGGHH